jgi:hypothetical protein
VIDGAIFLIWRDIEPQTLHLQRLQQFATMCINPLPQDKYSTFYNTTLILPDAYYVLRETEHVAQDKKCIICDDLNLFQDRHCPLLDKYHLILDKV